MVFEIFRTVMRHESCLVRAQSKKQALEKAKNENHPDILEPWNDGGEETDWPFLDDIRRVR